MNKAASEYQSSNQDHLGVTRFVCGSWVPFFFVVEVFGVKRSNSDICFGWSHQKRTELWLKDFFAQVERIVRASSCHSYKANVSLLLYIICLKNKLLLV